MLEFLMEGNQILRKWRATYSGITFIPSFINVFQLFQKLLWGKDTGHDAISLSYLTKLRKKDKKL